MASNRQAGALRRSNRDWSDEHLDDEESGNDSDVPVVSASFRFASDDDDDFEDLSVPRSLSSAITRASARSVAGPLPDYLKELIDIQKFNKSNPVKWFSMERLRAKAQTIKDLCGTIADRSLIT